VARADLGEGVGGDGLDFGDNEVGFLEFDDGPQRRAIEH
jgi:hypothetical protein